MHRYDPARQTLAIGLAGLAGLVDATGFVVAGGYFTSFMSGNTTRLGVDLMQRPALALVPLGLIASFLIGVILGSLIQRRVAGWRKRVLLGMVAGLLGLAAIALVAGWAALFLALSALAMGLANNIFSRDGEVTIGVTYMTGALVRFGQGVAARLGGQSRRTTRGYGLLWSALALGAVLGGGLCTIDSSLAAAASCALAALLWLAAWRIERAQPPAGN